MALLKFGLFISLLFISAAYGVEENPTKEDLLKKQAEVQLECSVINNVPQNYFELYLLGEATESRNGKCFMKCGMKGMGYLNDDGSLNDERVRSTTQLYYDNKEHQEVSFNAWMECGRKGPTESEVRSPCDRAFNLARCYIDEIKKAGMMVDLKASRE